MTKKEEELLLKDLCARLPYGVKVCIMLPNHQEKIFEPHIGDLKEITKIGGYLVNSKGIDYRSFNLDVKPYLRPMSSMTEEERKELNNQGYTKIAGELYHYCALSSNNAFYNPEKHPYVRMEYVIKLIDWLNKHHFDYRGLLEKGLALEAPDGMYNIKEK